MSRSGGGGDHIVDVADNGYVARERHKVSGDLYICEKMGGFSDVLIVGAILDQMKLTKPQTENAAELFELSKSEAALLDEVPMRGMPMPPTDPLIYRFYELLMINGPAWKALNEEEFGDGIMSAIGFDMTMERLPNAKGDRVKMSMSGKFLPYKYYGSNGNIAEYGFKEEWPRKRSGGRWFNRPPHVLRARPAAHSVFCARQMFKQPRHGLCTWIGITLKLLGIDIGGTPCLGFEKGCGPVGARAGRSGCRLKTVVQSLEGRCQRIDHGPVANACTANLLHAGKAGIECVAHRQAAGSAIAGCCKEDRQQYPGRASHGLAEFQADGTVELGVIGQRKTIHGLDQRAGCTCQGGAGIAIA